MLPRFVQLSLSGGALTVRFAENIIFAANILTQCQNNAIISIVTRCQNGKRCAISISRIWAWYWAMAAGLPQWQEQGSTLKWHIN